MSDNKYSLGHQVGSTNLVRITNPKLRGTIKAEEPDAGIPEPHFTGLTGTALNFDYAGGSLVANFTSDTLADAVTDINSLAPANIEASSENGHLVIRGLDGGGTNFLTITGGTAAPILGFRVDPLPGSSSFVGELETSATGDQQSQSNPQGTRLIAGDEDLSSAIVNRAIVGATEELYRLLRDLDVEVLVPKEIEVTVENHPILTFLPVFRLQDPSIRIPIRGITVSTPVVAGELDERYFLPEDTLSGLYPRMLNVYYDDYTQALDGNTPFATWGSPDGGTIYNKSASDDKQAATAITDIEADIITASGATFQTLDCHPGDHVRIQNATNSTPFSHNGEFIITEVLSETQIRVRRKSEFDRLIVDTEKPIALNDNLPGGTSYGDVQVLIGDFISADTLVFSVQGLAAGTHTVRILCGQKLQDLRLDTITSLRDSMLPVKALREVSERLFTHQDGSGFRHFTTDIDAGVIAGSPYSLSAGDLRDQITELLGHVNSLIAGNITYGGGVSWVDGTTNPSTDLESQVDKILTDLATGTGSDKVAHDAGPDWANGTTNPATSVGLQLDKVVTDLSADTSPDGAIKVGAVASGNLSQGTVRSQIDEFVATTAANDGASKVGAEASGNLALGTVRSQIDEFVSVAATDDGASKVGAEVKGQFASNTVRGQLDELAATALNQRTFWAHAEQGVGEGLWTLNFQPGAGELARWDYDGVGTQSYLLFPLHLFEGVIVDEIDVFYASNSDTAGIAMELLRVTVADSGPRNNESNVTLVGSVAVISSTPGVGNANSLIGVDMSPETPFTLLDTERLVIRIQPGEVEDAAREVFSARIRVRNA